MQQTLTNTIKGAGEIAIFMPSAVERFANDKRTALRTLIFPIVFYPFILAGFAERNEIFDVATLAFHALVSWAGFFLFYYILWLSVKNGERREHFWLCINMLNCQTIVSMALFAMGVFGYNFIGGPFEQYWIFYLLIDLAYVTFVVTYALRFPWTLGVFAATINMFIGDVGFRLIMAFHDFMDKT